MIQFLLSLTISLSAFADEKLRFDVLSALMANAKVSLKGREHCADFVTNKQETVGKFMAWSLSFYDFHQANSVAVSCNKQQVCSVDFLANSTGESPWACGLRFSYKKHLIDPATIECTGSC